MNQNTILTRPIIFLFLLFSLNSFAQSDEDYWAGWNSNYQEVNILEILKNEKHYADSVEKNPDIPPYYGRVDKYRFDAEYNGQVRPLEQSIRSSMKAIFKLFIGNPSMIDDLIDSEVLVKIGQDSLWMPVQKQILEALQEEITAGDSLTLYCLYLNEHSEKYGLRNIFIISEFIR